ncbi:MAG: PspC domain-containing protein [Vallitaleaceae bacterium]|nr:PspC domain-containing protein [Vallitaleaceae bacterium]
MNKKLYRTTKDKMISGVCGGIADYFSIDPTIVRIGTVILAFVTAFFPVFIGYIVCAAIMPEKPAGYISEQDVEVLDQDGNKMGSETEKKNNNKLIGIAFIGVGFFLLFDKLFWWFDHRSYWALAIVALGVYLLFSSRNKNTKDTNI